MSQTCLVDLSDLSGALGTEAVTRFAHTFVKMWPTRRERIRLAICHSDFDVAMDAVLSLHSGAAMAGAQLLAEHTNLIRGALVADGSPAWDHAHSLLATLDDLGDRTARSLADVDTRDLQGAR